MTVENSTVRFATQADAESILACLKLMHEENGLFSLSERRVRGIIDCALSPPTDMQIPPMIGVIGEPGNVEATICLTLTQTWYTDDWHLGDIWNFIRPDCRKKMYIDDLLKFAIGCSDKADLQLVMAVVSNKRTEAKSRIYQRHFGAPLGAVFVHRPVIARAA